MSAATWRLSTATKRLRAAAFIIVMSRLEVTNATLSQQPRRQVYRAAALPESGRHQPTTHMSFTAGRTPCRACVLPARPREATWEKPALRHFSAAAAGADVEEEAAQIDMVPGRPPRHDAMLPGRTLTGGGSSSRTAARRRYCNDIEAMRLRASKPCAKMIFADMVAAMSPQALDAFRAMSYIVRAAP